MEEKALRFSESNENLQQEFLKNLENKMDMKIEQLRLFDLKRENLIKSLEKYKELDNKRWSEQRSNLEIIQKNFDLKREQISEKHQKIEERLKYIQNNRLIEFASKRQEKFNKIRDETQKIEEKIERRNNKLMKKYHAHMDYILRRNKSMDIKKEIHKYFLFLFLFLFKFILFLFYSHFILIYIKLNRQATLDAHYGIQRRFESVCDKIKLVGESSLHNKNNDEKL